VALSVHGLAACLIEPVELQVLRRAVRSALLE
jgi:hypothetical protein